jgi:hypothetical protein
MIKGFLVPFSLPLLLLLSPASQGAEAHAFGRWWLPPPHQDNPQDNHNHPTTEITVSGVFRLIDGEENHQQDQANEEQEPAKFTLARLHSILTPFSTIVWLRKAIAFYH